MKKKLGIAAVYFYGKDEKWILDLHLKEIIKNTTNIDFTIYAATNRLGEQYKAILCNTPNLEIVELPYINDTGAKEHGQYLDLLIRHAIQNQCTHIITLDCDSWPIQQNWANNIIEKMTNKEVELAAVLRTELGDQWLPHPCGMVMTNSFIEKYNPKMWPDINEEDEDFSLFIKQTGQRMDTGIGIGYKLWKHKQNWVKLERSNKKNDHYLMAGVYEDCIFHLGATSRLKIFYKEFNSTWARKATQFLTKTPVIWKYRKKIEIGLLKILPPKIHFSNNEITPILL